MTSIWKIILLIFAFSNLISASDIVIENTPEELEERPALCKWPSKNYIPENGYLSCKYLYSFGESICKINCNAGYAFVAGDKDLLTCGSKTNLQWEPQLLSEKAEKDNFPKCTEISASHPTIEIVFNLKLVNTTSCLSLHEDGDSLLHKLERRLSSRLGTYFEPGAFPKVNILTKCYDGDHYDTLVEKVSILVTKDYGLIEQCKTRKCFEITRKRMEKVIRAMKSFQHSVEMGECKSFLVTNYVYAGFVKQSFSHETTSLKCFHGFALTRDNTCASCNPGYYANSGNSLYCEPCPIGTYADKIESPSCRKCPDGKTTKGLASDNSSDCISLDSLF